MVNSIFFLSRVSLKDKICNVTKVTDMTLKIDSMKWQCTGHICLETDNCWRNLSQSGDRILANGVEWWDDLRRRAGSD